MGVGGCFIYLFLIITQCSTTTSFGFKRRDLWVHRVGGGRDKVEIQKPSRDSVPWCIKSDNTSVGVKPPVFVI